MASKLSYWLGWHTSTQQDIYHTKADTSEHMGLVGPPALLRPCLLVPPAQLLDQWFDSLCWSISQQGNAPRPSDLISTKKNAIKESGGT